MIKRKNIDKVCIWKYNKIRLRKYFMPTSSRKGSLSNVYFIVVLNMLSLNLSFISRLREHIEKRKEGIKEDVGENLQVIEI